MTSNAAVRFDVPLAGCHSLPLMAYLKALGVLRLVSEQRDREARAWWHNGVFWLRSTLDRQALTNFFLAEYAPTPLVAPWGARSGFYPGPSESTARAALETIVNDRNQRTEAFRHAIADVRGLLGVSADSLGSGALSSACRSAAVLGA